MPKPTKPTALVRRTPFVPPFDNFKTRQLVSSDATVVEISARIGNDLVVRTGSSRRAKGDLHNPEVGYMVALARAFRSMANTLERRADGLVKHNDDVAEQRAPKARQAQIAQRQRWEERVGDPAKVRLAQSAAARRKTRAHGRKK